MPKNSQHRPRQNLPGKTDLSAKLESAQIGMNIRSERNKFHVVKKEPASATSKPGVQYSRKRDSKYSQAGN